MKIATQSLLHHGWARAGEADLQDGTGAEQLFPADCPLTFGISCDSDLTVAITKALQREARNAGTLADRRPFPESGTTTCTATGAPRAAVTACAEDKDLTIT